MKAARALVSIAHTDAVPNVEDRKLIFAWKARLICPSEKSVSSVAPDALKEKDVEIARKWLLFHLMGDD